MSKLSFAVITTLMAAAGAHAVCQLAPQPIPAPDQHSAVLLRAPHGPSSVKEQWESFNGARIVRNVTEATLEPILPQSSKATGAAVIIAPGGGFTMLSIDSEGYAAAHWLADHGIAAFILKYRLAPSPPDPSLFLADLRRHLQDVANRAESVATAPATSLEDAEAAVQTVRRRSAEWAIDPNRVGFLGFSAGAILTLRMGLLADATARPNYIGCIYGPLTAVTVPDDAPPLFAALAADDPLFGKGGFELISKWREMRRPVEFHYFERGGHGFGMNHLNKTSDLWIEEFYTWLMDRGVLRTKSLAPTL